MTFWRRLLSLAAVLACLTLSFGTVYHVQAREDPGSFGESALHRPQGSLKAMSLAVGTLSTVGAGRVAAESEAARAEQMIQEVVDRILELLSPFILVPPRRWRETGGGRRE